eukprot:SAG11_NODE_8311_length_1031_cov_1.101931_3_plen_53_part_01
MPVSNDSLSACHCMRQADLWDDVSEALSRMFGGRMGKLCSVAFEIAAGETDLM